MMVCLVPNDARGADAGRGGEGSRTLAEEAVVGRDRWEADGLRDVVCDDTLKVLVDPGTVSVADETGLLKQGKASCGAGWQYRHFSVRSANSHGRQQSCQA